MAWQAPPSEVQTGRAQGEGHTHGLPIVVACMRRPVRVEHVCFVEVEGEGAEGCEHAWKAQSYLCEKEGHGGAFEGWKEGEISRDRYLKTVHSTKVCTCDVP